MKIAAPQIDVSSRSASDRLPAQILTHLGKSLAPASPEERLWIGLLLTGVLAGACAYIWQAINGLKVTAMREYVFWGVYMTNFVFFIGVSHAGTLISAILRVTGAEWRRSITRMAEAITVFALMVGAPMVLIDMGRPDRVLNVVVHGRLNSPILWDVCSIATYLCGSILYLYVAMIPDLALLAPPKPVWERPNWRWRLYRTLSLGFTGTTEQKRLLEKALATMAVIIIPVAVSVHTVVSWIFGMTLRPGWHSTVFGPYFVIGAIFSGTAGIITAMVVFRKVYHLEPYLTERHFRNLGRLLLALNLLYIYFTLAEYLTAWYGAEVPDQRLLKVLMGSGPYAAGFWLWAVFGLFGPAFLIGWPAKNGLIGRLLIASLLINVGMWIKRYLIIVPTLMTPFIPAEAGGIAPKYLPTWVEWTVTLGGLSVFLLLFTLFAKLFPIISIWETVEGVEEIGASQIGVDLKPNEKKTNAHTWPAAALLVIGLLFSIQGSVANDADSLEKSPRIMLQTSEHDETQVCAAEVTVDGKPFENATVVFLVKRSFGWLQIGEEKSSAGGIALNPYPADLPGDPDGYLEVAAEVRDPPELASLRVSARFPAGIRIAPEHNPFPRALWSRQAPFGLLITIGTLLSIVWSTYSFVLVQLFKIKQSSKVDPRG